jgi:hypothetical protein
MLLSRAAGEEVQFECNVQALAVNPSQKLCGGWHKGILNQQTISKTVDTETAAGVLFMRV